MLVRQLDHVFPVITEWIAALRLDDDGAISPVRFLEAGMAVIPVSSRLLGRELVGEGFSRRYSVIADGRYAIHVERQNQPVPVNRGRFFQVVGNVDGDVFAFPEAKLRPRRGAVVPDAFLFEVAGIDDHGIDRDVIDAGLCG